MENLFNTAIFAYIIFQLIFIHQAIHAYHKYAYYIKESVFEILSMEDRIPVISIWNIPLVFMIVMLIVDAKASDNGTIALIILLVLITLITHYSRKYVVVVYETVEQIDTKTIPSPTPFKIAFGVPFSIGLILAIYILTRDANDTLLSALIAFSFSAVIIGIFVESFYPLYSKKKKQKSPPIPKKINFRWQPFVAVPMLFVTTVFSVNQLATVQCMKAIDTGATKSINFYCGVVSNLDLVRYDFSLWIVSQLSSNIWLLAVLFFGGLILFYWGEDAPIEQENPSSSKNENSNTGNNNNDKKSDDGFGFNSDKFNEGRFADDRFSTAKKKQTYTSADRAHQDPRTDPREAGKYLTYVRQADAGKVKGIKPYP